MFVDENHKLERLKSDKNSLKKNHLPFLLLGNLCQEWILGARRQKETWLIENDQFRLALYISFRLKKKNERNRLRID